MRQLKSRTKIEARERFHYNLAFEHALRDLLGVSYRGCAGSATRISFLKSSMFRAIGRIRDRLHSITPMDERLELTTSIDLERMERAIRDLSKTSYAEWDIIASLLNLVAHLLGYDWVDGEIHRHVVFFRDRGQEIFDHNTKFPPKNAFRDQLRHLRVRYATINHLSKNLGLGENGIARVLGISEYLTKQVLKRVSFFESSERVSFPTLEQLEETPLIYEFGYQKDSASPYVEWKHANVHTKK